MHQACLRVLTVHLLLLAQTILLATEHWSATLSLRQVNPHVVVFFLECDRDAVRLDLDARRGRRNMIAQWLEQESHVLALEPSDLEIARVSLERALDCFLVVRTDTIQVLRQVDLDEARLVLVPTVVLYRHELHVREVKRLATRSLYLVLLLLLHNMFVHFSLHSSCPHSLVNLTRDDSNFTRENSLGVLTSGLIYHSFELRQILLEFFDTTHL